MHWYDGNIAEAVALSKQRNAIFVVFVEGEDEQSAELAQTLDASPVESRLTDQNSFLAVKLKSGSETYLQFARIYQLVPVPSLFFIGRSGTPLEVVCAGVSPDTLAGRIDRILHTHKSEAAPAPTFQPSTSAQSVLRERTASLLRAESATPAGPSTSATAASSKRPSAECERPVAPSETTSAPPDSDKGYDIVCDGDVCVKRQKTDRDDPGPSGVTKSPEVKSPAPSNSEQISEADKIERAKALIEAKRREQAEKEKELEKQREIERRNTGKSVAELKRWQAEQELKQIQEERKREKMENNLARQRILEQIAQDRAERRARDLPPPVPPATQPPLASSSGGDGSGRCRIQFKLPDGQSHTAHFQSTDTLAQVRDYVASNFNMSPTQFSLWTAFPRAELRPSEVSVSVGALGLLPSAALLVLPAATATAQLAQPGPIATVLELIRQLVSRLVVYPLEWAVQWARAALWGPPPPPPPPPAAPPATPAPPHAGGSTVGGRDDGPRPVRRIANIHRLSPDRGADDDNNTWNGNSTQQM